MFNNRYFSDEEKMEQNRSFENKDKELRTRIANMVLQILKIIVWIMNIILNWKIKSKRKQSKRVLRTFVYK